MKSKNKDSDKDIVKTTRGLSPRPSSGLIAFEDLDRWFDDVLSRRPLAASICMGIRVFLKKD
jgi:hypothetical protein